MKNVIQHKMQTEELNCVSACLAMILNLDVEKVTDDFHQGYVNGNKEPHEYLDNKIDYRKCLACERRMKQNHVYMVSVPSINMVGGSHMMVIHRSSDECWITYDPNEGKEGRLVYGANDGFVQIVSWSVVYEFKIEDVAALYDIDDPFNGEYVGCEK